MRMVTMDDEGAALMLAGMEMAQAALKARVVRLDPDGLLGRSLAMSEVKVNDVLRQLNAGPLAGWKDFNETDREKFIEYLEAFIATERDDEREILYNAIKSVVLIRRDLAPSRPEFTRGIDPKVPDHGVPRGPGGPPSR